MVQIIIINGPNLNLLGVRQPEIYGTTSFESYFDLLDKIHGVGYRYDGIVLNAGGFTHTSIAIADALRAITTPVIEVHLTNIYAREAFRHTNYIRESAIHSIVGNGLEGYRQAIEYLRDHVINK